MYTTKITHADIKVNPELEKLLCPLSEDEFKALEDSIFADGLQDAVKVWIDPEDSKCYLVDGHNRYTIHEKYDMEIPEDKITVLDIEKYQTKDDVMFYMLQYQLGRRNLSLQQRYHLVEINAPLLEKKAKENQSNGGKGLTTLTKVNVRKEKADMVGCSEGTYHKLDKIFQSDNDEIKQKVDTEEISINKAYKEIKGTDKDKTSKIIRRCIICKKEKPILEFRDVDDDDQYYSHCRSCNKDIEPKKHTIISNLQTSLKTSGILESDPTPVPKTTADYDKEIVDIEAEITALYEMKTRVIQDRYKAFQADNSKLRCEYTEEHNATWSRYSFYLVKGENEIDLFAYFNDFFVKDYTEFMEEIERKLKYFEFTSQYSKYSKLLKDEKAVIKAKLIDMRETVKQDRENQKEAEEARKKVRDESFNQNLNQALGDLFRPQFTGQQRVWMKKIYHAGAKVLHSDTNDESDEAMQFLNQLKESWGV